MSVAGPQRGLDKPPFVVAEIGVNHNGRVDQAHALIAAAVRAGADAVKFQCFDPDQLVGPDAPLAEYQRQTGATDARDLLRPLALAPDVLNALAARVHDAGLAAVVTPFAPELVPALARGPWDAWKVASPDIVHRPLIEALVATGRPLFVSTGAAELDEVRAARAWMGAHPHVFFQCVSAYPTPDEDAALGGLRALAALGADPLGYSDHTTAEDTGALAVACGAALLEKHLTRDRGQAGPDHAISLEPDGFARYVRAAHRAWRMIGPAEKRVARIEVDVRNAARQSIHLVAARPAGHVLTEADVTVHRPAAGLAPHRLAEVCGRRLIRSCSAGAPLRGTDLESD